MIAAVCSWHEHHQAAANDMERRLAGRAKMIVAAPSLIGVRCADSLSPAASIVSANGFDSAGK
jgi:hypothetical protein